jgi:hypothetical protein
VRTRHQAIGNGPFRVGPLGVGFVREQLPANQRQPGRRRRSGGTQRAIDEATLGFRRVLRERVDVQPIDLQRVSGPGPSHPFRSDDAAQTAHEHLDLIDRPGWGVVAPQTVDQPVH